MWILHCRFSRVFFIGLGIDHALPLSIATWLARDRVRGRVMVS